AGLSRCPGLSRSSGLARCSVFTGLTRCSVLAGLAGCPGLARLPGRRGLTGLTRRVHLWACRLTGLDLTRRRHRHGRQNRSNHRASAPRCPQDFSETRIAFGRH
ncbi:MAG: hypothetical protein ACJ72I_00130, partial [Pseudonocardiaceae bacterium]